MKPPRKTPASILLGPYVSGGGSSATPKSSLLPSSAYELDAKQAIATTAAIDDSLRIFPLKGNLKPRARPISTRLPKKVVTTQTSAPDDALIASVARQHFV